MIIAPSILTADFTDLASEIKKIETADYIHIDIMDGHFVPNISFGPAITKQINDLSNMPLDIHLMVSKPLEWISKFSLDKVSYITIHQEAENYFEALEAIRRNHIKTGISIKPQTCIKAIEPLLSDIDLVLIMTVEPGFGGQSFMNDMMDKVKALVAYREKHQLSFMIEVDGGINDQTIEICKKAGVDMAVAGSYVFNHKNPKQAIESLK